ncbi:hypothetical protein O9G_002806 [Rozella allomycis CSF55]|uniref:Uncharacterized protein n=1 Tax=Rozella allomycis (strain CSF55) TaxID=988480 RepID=A0A075AMN2_ROZAC|nr:hypothetical protein O9G_002806 [Rozella allomycis CSF55]|eukprot:EPZ30929.1 hypothetical protein O9G_002806 [Rozella allomycis CSF55]
MVLESKEASLVAFDYSNNLLLHLSEPNGLMPDEHLSSSACYEYESQMVFIIGTSTGRVLFYILKEGVFIQVYSFSLKEEILLLHTCNQVGKTLELDTRHWANGKTQY